MNMLNSVRQASGRLDLYSSELDQEPWKKDHIEAMACLSFEETLKFGVDLFDFMIAIDETLARQVFKPVDAKLRELIDNTSRDVAGLFERWLAPCADVERRVKYFEGKGYKIDLAAEFRKRHAEALWMKRPASERFSDPRFAAARDQAIDAMHNGRVESMPC